VKSVKEGVPFVEGINKCLDLIKGQLVEYLLTIPTVIPKNPGIEQTLSREIVNVPSGNIKFLVFNYTRIIEQYLSHIGVKSNQVIYIHGSLDDEKNPIIFGYGDVMNPYYSKIEDLNENEYLKNIKSFSYLKATNKTQLKEFIERGEYSVSIMGHSCGLSDRVLLNSIFCHKNCKGIRIYYHQKGPNETDYFEKTMEISRHCKPEDKDRINNLIVSAALSYPLS